MKKGFFLTVGLALFMWSKKTASHEDVISAGAYSFDNWMKANDDKRVTICKAESKKEFTSLKEASEAVNFMVKYPENLKDNKLLGIFVSHFNTLTLLFDNGFYITQRKSNIVPDYSNFDAPRLITVNKFAGMGGEPHINDFDTDKKPRPGFAEWYEDGVVYSVFGDTIPLAKLINIADSMKNCLEHNE